MNTLSYLNEEPVTTGVVCGLSSPYTVINDNWYTCHVKCGEFTGDVIPGGHE